MMLVYFPLFSSCGDEETGSHPLPGRDACAPSRCKTVRRSQELRHELTGSAGRARCLLDPAQLGVSVMQSFDRRQVCSPHSPAMREQVAACRARVRQLFAARPPSPVRSTVPPHPRFSPGSCVAHRRRWPCPRLRDLSAQHGRQVAAPAPVKPSGLDRE